jgi:hypothetical protein
VNELGAAAVAYAERGWHVFPVAPRGKVPVTKRRMLDASLDEGLVAAWWEQRLQANIGVACGPSGLVVVDLDGEEAVRGWADLVARHGGHERTLVARTGKGFHLYFAGEGRSSAGRIGPRIDTRGAGGYVIAPPSVHGSGAVYQWIDATLDPVPVPDWLTEALERGGISLHPLFTQAYLEASAADTPCMTPNPFTYTHKGRDASYTTFCEGTPEFNGVYGHGIVDCAWSGHLREPLRQQLVHVGLVQRRRGADSAPSRFIR